MNATLVERVKVLAAQRRAEVELATMLKAKREAFDAEQADLIQAVQNARAAVNDSELMVRVLAVDAYAVSKDRAPAVGVTIRVGRRYEVDAVAGLEWARKAGMCLIPEALDVKAVEKIAAATPLAFVTVSEVPWCAIATDLDKALAADAAPNMEVVAS